MKILSGALRGQTIHFKASGRLRPTSDKARKAIFDVIRQEVSGKKVLDLFSGTGALGIEALSCGAREVTFVEMHKPQAQNLKANLRALGLEGSASVVAAEALDIVKKFSAAGHSYDLILADPPYEKGLAQLTLEVLAASKLLHSKTWVIVECFKKESTADRIGRLEKIKTKLYGDTQVLFYKVL